MNGLKNIGGMCWTTVIDNENWTCKQTITKAADEVIKEGSGRQRNDWLNQECKKVVQRKNAAYKEMILKHYTKELHKTTKNKGEKRKRQIQ
jgi:hypothetical protein